jgi:hypothetical protein
VIVEQINIESLAMLEMKDDTPVCSGVTAQKLLRPPFSGCSRKLGRFNSSSVSTPSRAGQSLAYPLCHLRRRFSGIVLLEKPSPPFASRPRVGDL